MRVRRLKLLIKFYCILHAKLLFTLNLSQRIISYEKTCSLSCRIYVIVGYWFIRFPLLPFKFIFFNQSRNSEFGGWVSYSVLELFKLEDYISIATMNTYTINISINWKFLFPMRSAFTSEYFTILLWNCMQTCQNIKILFVLSVIYWILSF